MNQTFDMHNDDDKRETGNSEPNVIESMDNNDNQYYHGKKVQLNTYMNT